MICWFFFFLSQTLFQEIRKPHPQIYQRCEERLKALRPGLISEDIVFLDDIARNLKVPRSMGWRTIHVRGDGKDALRELFSELLWCEQSKL